MLIEKFKFNQDENKFAWEDSHMKLEFSNPSIEPIYGYFPIINEDDIVWFKYIVKIFKKNKNYNNKTHQYENETILIDTNYGADSPQILCLQYIIKEQLKIDPRKKGQKITSSYEEDLTYYKETLEVESDTCDDYYKITKVVDENGRNEFYDVYCGSGIRCGWRACGVETRNSFGVLSRYITKQELVELLKCVNAFIGYSIQTYNKNIDMYRNKIKIIRNKIYEFDREFKEINSILEVGDRARMLIDGNNGRHHIEEVIKNISPDTVTFHDNSSYNIRNILYLEKIFPE